MIDKFLQNITCNYEMKVYNDSGIDIAEAG